MFSSLRFSLRGPRDVPRKIGDLRELLLQKDDADTDGDGYSNSTESKPSSADRILLQQKFPGDLQSLKGPSGSHKD
jgi:hypothetical protein